MAFLMKSPLGIGSLMSHAPHIPGTMVGGAQPAQMPPPSGGSDSGDMQEAVRKILMQMLSSGAAPPAAPPASPARSSSSPLSPLFNAATSQLSGNYYASILPHMSLLSKLFGH